MTDDKILKAFGYVARSYIAGNITKAAYLLELQRASNRLMLLCGYDPLEAKQALDNVHAVCATEVRFNLPSTR